MPSQRGPHLEQLPGDAVVIRLGQSSDGKLPPEAFNLSSDDKECEPPRSSVWDSDQTTPELAHELMGQKPMYNTVGFMRVSDIRQVTEEAVSVVWDHDPRPEAGGHCGLVGFGKEKSKTARERRGRLRRLLADLANGDERTRTFR